MDVIYYDHINVYKRKKEMEGFDLNTQCPKQFKQFYHLRSAVLIKFKDEHQNITNGIKLKIKYSPSQHLTSSTKRRFSFTTSSLPSSTEPETDISNHKTIAKLIFNFTNTTDCDVWYQVLYRAIGWYQELQQEELKHQEYLKLLELAGNVTCHQITKAYKRLCLKLHPDKGGNPDQFNEVRVAYTTLLARQTFVEEQQHTKSITYEAIVEKVAGLGLGITVSEDKARRALLVQGVNPNIKLHGITEESGGHIVAGDVLIGINADDCSKWWMSRIRVRLDNTRVPINTKVTLTFERRVPKEDSDLQGDKEGSVYDSPVRAMSPMSSTPFKQDSSNANHNNSNTPLSSSSNSAPNLTLPSERRASTAHHVDMGTDSKATMDFLPAGTTKPAERRASTAHHVDMGSEEAASSNVAKHFLPPSNSERRASTAHHVDIGTNAASWPGDNLLPSASSSAAAAGQQPHRRASTAHHVDIGTEDSEDAKVASHGLLTGLSATVPVPQRRASALAHVDLGASNAATTGQETYFLHNEEDNNISIAPAGGRRPSLAMPEVQPSPVEGEGEEFDEIEIDMEYLQQQEERIDTLEEEKMSLVQRIEDLEDCNVSLQHQVEELKGDVFQREEEVIALNQHLVETKKQLTEMVHENASLKQVLEGQYQDSTTKEFRDYIVVLQERLLDYDMQHRDLVYQLQQAQQAQQQQPSNNGGSGNIADELYQFNEERVLKMEQSLQRMIGRKLHHSHHHKAKQ